MFTSLFFFLILSQEKSARAYSIMLPAVTPKILKIIECVCEIIYIGLFRL